MTTSIFLADDHTIFREGLRALLSTESQFRIIGETGNGLEAVELVEALHPDVLVLDLEMPGLKGLEVIRQIRKHNTTTRIIVLSMHTKEAYVLQALRYGANAYVLKDADSQELIRAIYQTIAGNRYLSPPLSERAIEAYLLKSQEQSLDLYETLTDRERLILHLAAEGASNTEIAKRLVISARTVEAHRARMMRKLGLKNETDLIRYAIQRGIIPIDE